MTNSRQAAERSFAIEVVQTLRNAGHEAYWAGGCVRDQILGLIPGDYDVATSAHPEQVRRLFARTVAVGISFGVVNIIHFLANPDEPPIQVEVATFRIDGGYSDGRRPDQVTFSSAREDALRRDFTINGMFFDPIDHQVLDYVGGREDLKNHILRAIGDPELRFQEDKLRLLRAVRIASRFRLTIEPKTERSIRSLALGVRQCSAERIAEELRKILVHSNRAEAMKLLVDLGIANAVLPELLPMTEIREDGSKILDPSPSTSTLWDHVLHVLKLIKDPSVPLAFAALLQEVSPPRGSQQNQEHPEQFQQKKSPVQIAEDLCIRLKMSNEERTRIAWLISNCKSLQNAKTLRMSRLKPLLIHPGIQELIALHRANAQANNQSEESLRYCEQLLAEFGPEQLDPAPLVTGYDLKQLNINPGPVYKRLLDSVRELQLDNQIQTRDEAISVILRMLKESGS